MAPADARLILASASPRRSKLLGDRGYDFEVRAADVAETLPADSDHPAAEAERLAEAKARAVVGAVGEPGRWVLGADTIVVLGRRIIGKPRDSRDAVSILRTLSGTEHAVVTGVALVQSGTGRSLIRHAVTRVRMHRVAEAEIRRYVARGASRGKAGAYAVQEGGDRYIEAMDGSFTNVVGLPMELLDEMLAQVGWKGATER